MQTPDEDDTDADVLLEEMLGGISFQAEWKEEFAEVSPQTTSQGKVRESTTLKQVHFSVATRTPAPPLADPSNTVFNFAYRCSGYCTINGKLERPPLQVVDLGGNRGQGLIATSPIARGSVIYTERAAAACQVPPIRIQACQYCFRSLEGIDTLSAQLPCLDLWPVTKLDFTQEAAANNLQEDKFGRIRCGLCKSLFCTKYHMEAFNQEYGSCCKVSQILKAVETLDKEGAVQAQVALAARLFVHCAQHYRQNGQSLGGHFLRGFCGSAADLDFLELGVKDKEGRFTLGPLYDNTATILQLTNLEQETLSLEYFHKLASQAARNGFGILTQSPFKIYYGALLRKSMSRDSEEHQRNMRQVAQALVGSNQLERGMDRDIEAKVAPEVCAVFPLTARCNHSCEPNAEVKSQEFVDCHIDVVALRDISIGEELLISYIPCGAGVGKRSTAQRRRELQAKYMFYCDCPRCISNM